MRVFVVSGLYPKPGSPLSGLFVHRQVEASRAAGVDARVVCPVARSMVPFRDGTEFAASLDRPREDEVEGVPVTYVPYRHVPHRLSTRLEAASIVRSLRSHFDRADRKPPELVHGHWLFPAGWAAVELASDWGVPSVVTAHGSDVHRYPRSNRGTARFTRRTLRRADRAVAVCGDLAAQMEDLAGASVSTAVVYNGVDAELFGPPEDRGAARRVSGLPESGVGVCSVSRLVAEKGVRELLEAFVRAAEAHGDLWLSLVGDGPLREELAARALEQGVSDRVFLPGPVPHAEVATWMQAADVFALPSHAEGLPVSVLEAMACGLPVIASDVGGIPEVVDRTVGRLVEPRNPPEVADRLRELAADMELRRRLGAEARRRVERRFTWRRSAEQLADVYREVARWPRGVDGGPGPAGRRLGDGEPSVPEGVR